MPDVSQSETPTNVKLQIITDTLESTNIQIRPSSPTHSPAQTQTDPIELTPPAPPQQEQVRHSFFNGKKTHLCFSVENHSHQ